MKQNWDKMTQIHVHNYFIRISEIDGINGNKHVIPYYSEKD